VAQEQTTAHTDGTAAGERAAREALQRAVAQTQRSQRQAISQRKQVGRASAQAQDRDAPHSVHKPHGLTTKGWMQAQIDQAKSALHKAAEDPATAGNGSDKKVLKYMNKANHLLAKLPAMGDVKPNGGLTGDQLADISEEAASEATAAALDHIQEMATDAGIQAGMTAARKELERNPKDVAASVEAKLQRFKHVAADYDAGHLARRMGDRARFAAQNALHVAQAASASKIEAILGEEEQGEKPVPVQAYLTQGHKASLEASFSPPAKKTAKRFVKDLARKDRKAVAPQGAVAAMASTALPHIRKQQVGSVKGPKPTPEAKEVKLPLNEQAELAKLQATIMKDAKAAERKEAQLQKAHDMEQQPAPRQDKAPPQVAPHRLKKHVTKGIQNAIAQAIAKANGAKPPKSTMLSSRQHEAKHPQPQVQPPEAKAPMELPEAKAPMELPEAKAPMELPEAKAPEVKAPEVKAPENVPDAEWSVIATEVSDNNAEEVAREGEVMPPMGGPAPVAADIDVEAQVDAGFSQVFDAAL